MIYESVQKGIFIERSNRFVALVETEGRREVCHVKNTGRCKELLLPGVEVVLEYRPSTARKTAYDLIAVYKGERLINMDSQAPNQVVREMLLEGRLFPEVTLVKPEQAYGSSRFDFYVETSERKLFVEVKGVTLEENGAARFPDAPTLRGIKHLQELVRCLQDGYEAVVLFVVQMKGIYSFEPNTATHPAFASALWEAEQAGVKILAYDCLVSENSLRIDKQVPVRIFPEAPPFCP